MTLQSAKPRGRGRPASSISKECRLEMDAVTGFFYGEAFRSCVAFPGTPSEGDSAKSGRQAYLERYNYALHFGETL